MGFVLPEGYNPLFMTGPRLGARVDPRTNRGDFVRDRGHPRYSPVEEQMHPAAGYYGETSRDDIIRARQSRPVFTIESGHDPVNLLDPEPQQENATSAFKQGVRNRLMTLMMGRMNK